MARNHQERNDAERGVPFVLSAGAVVAISIVMGILGINKLRREPVAKAAEPVKSEAPKITGPVVSPPPAPRPAPPKAPAQARIRAEIVSGPFDGVWKYPGKAVPIIEVKNSGATPSGTYVAPTWSGPFPLTDAVVRNNVMEFVVSDEVDRMHVRLTLLKSRECKVEVWRAPEDLVKMVAHYNKPGVLKSVQQVAAIRTMLEQEGKRTGKAVGWGVFKRSSDPGADRG